MQSHECIQWAMEKNQPNKYFRNQSLEPWCLLFIELALKHGVHDATRSNDQEKIGCYSFMDFTKLHIYIHFNIQKLIFSILKMCLF